jgi:hypothetical protein
MLSERVIVAMDVIVLDARIDMALHVHNQDTLVSSNESYD